MRNNVVLLDNLVMRQGIDFLRSSRTDTSTFTWVAKNLGRDILYEIITKECNSETKKVETPLSQYENLNTYAEGYIIKEDFVLVEILRAAQPLVHGAIERIDEIRTIKRSWGLVDATRKEEGTDLKRCLENWEDTEMKVDYMAWKIPPSGNDSIITIFDPMLATASTLGAVLKRIGKERNYKKLISASVFASNYGITKMSERFPDVKFYTCVIDYGGIQGNLNGDIVGTGLNEKGYIVPGCGDFGDRTANTPSKG